jgi:DNA invertase Pin-like site-specific DNA recombinase
MIGIYARISREKEDVDRSIQDQIKTGIELAEKLGISYSVYQEEDGTSGSLPIKQRPQLQRLVNDIIEGNITKVFAFDQSRLERNEETRYVLKRLFKEEKIQVYFNNGLQGESLEGDLAGDIISRVNQYYLEITAHKIKSVLNRNAKEGRRFSFLHFGFTTDSDKRLVIDEEQAKVVKRIFALSLEGKGTGKIAEILNSEGVPTCYNMLEGTYKVVNKYTGEVQKRDKKSTKWKGGTIRGLITNPIYKGERRWNNTTYQVPAILDDWYWQKVNDNLKNNSNNKGQAVTHSYLLKGLIRCGKCGANYYGRTRVAKDGLKPKDNYYMCSSKRRGEHNCGNRSISIEVLDGLIWYHLFFGGKMREILKHQLNNTEVSKKLIETQEKINSGIEQVSKIEYQRNKIIEAISNDVITFDDARQTIDKLKAEKKQIEIELRKYEVIEGDILSSQELQNESLNYRENIEQMNKDERIELIKKFVKNIEIINTPESIFPSSPYPKFDVKSLSKEAQNVANQTNCFVVIQFNLYGLKDEVYCMSADRKYCLSIPTNGATNTNEFHQLNIKDWAVTFSNL